jgi:hypothetical protein
MNIQTLIFPVLWIRPRWHGPQLTILEARASTPYNAVLQTNHSPGVVSICITLLKMPLCPKSHMTFHPGKGS